MRAANTSFPWRAGIRAPLAATLSAALLGLVLVLPSSVSAADAERPSRRVSYAGLDLDNPADVASFNRRLTLAAEKVCRPESESVALRIRRIGERCMADAIARTLERLDDRALSAKLLAASGRKTGP